MRRLETTAARGARAALALAAVCSLGGCATMKRDSGPAHYAATSGPTPTGRSSRGSPRFGDFVRARQPQLQFCYSEARRKHPKLAGSATVAVTLADDGAVANADIVRRSWSEKGGKDVEKCMLAKLRAWHFPPVDPDEPHTHSFAVIFSS